MKTSLALLALVGSSAALPAAYIEQNHALLWANFKAEHGKTYSAEEEPVRMQVFKKNMLKAADLEAQNPQARFGMNKFSDLTAEEFAATHHNLQVPQKASPANIYSAEEVRRLTASGVDWRNTAVTHVKDQAQCGSCWSYSATGGIEGQNALKGTRQLVALSEQELVSCDKVDQGCNGGLMDNAFRWLISKKGGNIVTEEAYPYTSGAGRVAACKDVSSMPVGATVTGYKDLPHDEDQMAAWMQENGPISIAVDASRWQTYTGGVMTNCGGFLQNHGVLAVGFTDKGEWVIKNSWGTSWGESGYIRVAKGSNQCLLKNAPSYPIVGNGPAPAPVPTPPGPSPPAATGFAQKVCGDSACSQGCTSSTLPLNVCLAVTGGGSALATACDDSGVTLKQFILSSDCTGFSISTTQPVNTCGPTAQGTFVENVCGAFAGQAVGKEVYLH